MISLVMLTHSVVMNLCVSLGIAHVQSRHFEFAVRCMARLHVVRASLLSLRRRCERACISTLYAVVFLLTSHPSLFFYCTLRCVCAHVDALFACAIFNNSPSVGNISKTKVCGSFFLKQIFNFFLDFLKILNFFFEF